MRYALLLAFLVGWNTMNAQIMDYDFFIKQADSLYQLKHYKASALAFSKAFKSNGGKGRLDHRINAARSWILANVPDSAYFNLERVIATGHYSDYDYLHTEAAFKSLHPEKRWHDLMAQVKKFKEKSEINLNRPLANTLDSIYKSDQYWRFKMDSVVKQLGSNSPEFQIVAQKMHDTDSANLIKVKSILDQYGWPGREIVGEKGNTALFLVIQHADLETQVYYLPMLREAVKNGKAAGSELALLEDRIALRKGGLQKYGSQIGRNEKTGRFYVLPLEDPESVDQRRAEVGLNSIREYVKSWGIDWSIDRYKKDIIESENP